MKIMNIELPKIIKYYLSDSIQNKLLECFNSSNALIDGDTLIIDMANNAEVFDALQVIKDKIQCTTIGNGKLLYEYELDISIRDGHIFIFTLEDGNSYTCSISDISNNSKNNIKIKFKI